MIRKIMFLAFAIIGNTFFIYTQNNINGNGKINISYALKDSINKFLTHINDTCYYENGKYIVGGKVTFRSILDLNEADSSTVYSEEVDSLLTSIERMLFDSSTVTYPEYSCIFVQLNSDFIISNIRKSDSSNISFEDAMKYPPMGRWVLRRGYYKKDFYSQYLDFKRKKNIESMIVSNKYFFQRFVTIKGDFALIIVLTPDIELITLQDYQLDQKR